MINQDTVRKLHELRLSSMADAFMQQMTETEMQILGFEERFGLIVDAEWNRRKSNHRNRLIKQAGLHILNASLEGIQYNSDRHLDRGLLARLSTCQYIAENRNIVILGATGAGKTYMACALGNAACRNYYSVKYIRLPDLLNELAVARYETNFTKVIQVYQKVRLLIIDEWLLLPLSSSESRDSLEIISKRHQASSTIFCSQFKPDGWHKMIGVDTLADAILDRIVHNSYTIHIQGKESMRKQEAVSISDI